MRILYVAVLCAGFAFSGCSRLDTSVSGGGNDFPNPALGVIIADGLAKGDHWDDSMTLPVTPSSVLAAQSVSVPTMPSLHHGASSQSIRFDLSDATRLGIVRVYYDLSSDSVIKNDTLILLYDDAFLDSTIKNKHLYLYTGKSVFPLTQMQTRYRFVDSDGDSIINNRDGRPNRVFIAIATVSALGAVAVSEMEYDGGKDGDLDTKTDNRLRQCRVTALSAGGDTLSYARYEAYRGDSVIIDPSGPDSTLVRLRLMDTDLLKRRTASEAIFLVFPSDSIKNQPVYFRSVKAMNNGGTVTSLIRGATDSLFYAGDTVLAYGIVDAPNDIVTSDTLRMKVLLGKLPADSMGNSLLGIFSHVSKGKSNDRETIFSFSSDTPLSRGQKPISGSFSLRLLYAGGQWIDLEGSFTQDVITATYTNSKGETKLLKWDREGNEVR